ASAADGREALAVRLEMHGRLLAGNQERRPRRRVERRDHEPGVAAEQGEFSRWVEVDSPHGTVGARSRPGGFEGRLVERPGASRAVGITDDYCTACWCDRQGRHVGRAIVEAGP